MWFGELDGRGFISLNIDKDSIGDSGAPKGESSAPALDVANLFGSHAASAFTAELPAWFQATADGSDIMKNPGLTGDTVPANTSTTFSVTIGGPAEVGYINTNTDRDWYAVELVAGQYYEFTMDPGAGLDAVLQLRGSNGGLLGSSDGPNEGDTEVVGFYATTSGTYYLVADGFQTTKGEYSLSAVTAPLPSPLDAIDWGGGSVANPEVILVYFAQSGEVFDGVSSLGWNAYEQQQAMLAFAQYENIIGVDFQVTTDSNAADFHLVTTNSTQYLGYFNPPGTAGAGVGVFARNGTGWDEAGGGGLELGGFGFITMVHEFGHGMGLAHPHDNGGGSDVMLGVTGSFGSYGLFDMNQGIYTTMSYNDGWQTGENGESPSVQYGYQSAPMALDIAILQDKYGANSNFNNGDTNYALSTANAFGTYYSSIWDTGGNDTISYAGSADAVIDLRAATLDYSEIGGGAISWVDNIFGGYTIANGVVIENAIGGSGDDAITGNSAANTLTGGQGDDTMTGGAGDDTFVFAAGDGDDVITDFTAGGSQDSLQVTGFASYTLQQEGAHLRVVFDANNSILLQNVTQAQFTAADINIGGSTGEIDGTAGPDTLDGTPEDDVINGLGGNDILNGLGGNDTLNGGNNDDRLVGGTGVDTTNGGLGNDWHFVDNAADVVVEAAGEGTADRVFASVSYTLGGAAEIEILSTTNQALTTAINLTGNGFNQTVAGNDGANTLDGAGGNDVLLGNGGNDILIGGLGNDILNGGAGTDTVDYSSAASAITVQASGLVTGGAGNDSLIDVENIIGTGFHDVLNGNASNNVITGGNGNDQLIGGAGVDTTIGGLGNDWHFVDNAADTVVEAAGQGTDRVFAATSYALAAGVEIEILSTTLAAGTDAINLTGNEFNQTVAGNEGVNTLDGGGGNDVLLGGGGDDWLVGGLGNDTLNGGAGTDTADYSAAVSGISVNGSGLVTGGAGTDSLIDVENIIGTGFNDVLNGNASANVLTGGNGNDQLIGGAGADITDGGLGDDWHFVDNAGDVVMEGVGQGTADRVFASTDYALAAGAEIEILSTTLTSGTGAINLVGNEFNQTIAGNDGSNFLNGLGGADTLYGNGGSDFLNGGAGNDSLWGGAGVDQFWFDLPTFGADTIRDWQDGVDIIRINVSAGGADEFSDVAISQAGINTLITFPDGSTITLSGISAATVTVDDFLFTGP